MYYGTYLWFYHSRNAGACLHRAHAYAYTENFRVCNFADSLHREKSENEPSAKNTCYTVRLCTSQYTLLETHCQFSHMYTSLMQCIPSSVRPSILLTRVVCLKLLPPKTPLMAMLWLRYMCILSDAVHVCVYVILLYFEITCILTGGTGASHHLV